MNGVVHNFWDNLAASNKLSDEGDWITFYRRLWPDMLTALRLDAASEWQRWGVDRVLFLPNGKQLLIDEKKRTTKYDDFLCEEWSVYRNKCGVKVGWTLDANKRCDFIAYAIPLLGKCYMLPFELLRITAQINLLEWKTATGTRSAPNHDYETINVVVPWDRLFTDMRRQMHRKFSDKLDLPVPKHTFVDGQAVFEWGADKPVTGQSPGAA